MQVTKRKKTYFGTFFKSAILYIYTTLEISIRVCTVTNGFFEEINTILKLRFTS